jgi:DNA-binding MarR family transcriptional regulator
MSTEQTADELLRTLFSIRRTGRRIAGRPAEFASLTGAQLELVRLVRQRPGVSVAEAARELRLAPNTVSTLVRQLTETGIVVRTVDGADRRVARLELAAELRRKVNTWRDRRVVALGGAIGELPAAQQRRLVEALPALAQLAKQFEATA